MLILGLSDSHDASVSLMEDGKILAAVSEERFTRKKRQQGFPYKSLEYAKGFIRNRDIESVYIAGRYGRAIFRIFDSAYAKGKPHKDILSFSSKTAYWLENSIASLPFIRDLESKISLFVIKRRLKKAGIKYSGIDLLDHHYSHIISALSGISSDNYLAVSLDAYGDGKSGLAVNVSYGKALDIKQISFRDSVAQFYGFICSYLGFAEGEEGKVMALAGFGNPEKLNDIFRRNFVVNELGIKVSPGYKSSSFNKILKNNKKEDIAAALQNTVEDVILEFIRTFALDGRRPDLFLSGGFFANIKVNQRLHETKLFNRIFIFPNMGDGGTSFLPLVRKFKGNIEKTELIRIKDVYLGPEYDDEYIESLLKAGALIYTKEDNIEKRLACLLSEGKTVARFSGRMEYGPRALGNRSILYQSTDKSVSDWLNRKLRRTEFMPFAPVTLFDYKDKCYLNIKGKEDAAKFMTISVDCTQWMKEVSPGVVHIDGTARPQLITQEDNPGYYKILKEYHKLTGIPSLINTSFNMHGEPIVCSPQEALQTFKEAGLDFLAINNFLVEAPKNNSVKIVLINPVTRNRTKVLRVERCQQKVITPVGIWPPISLLEIAAYLEYGGFKNVEIMDAEVEGLSFGRLIEETAKKSPDMIVIQATTPTINDDILFSARIKEKLKNAAVVFVGLHGTVFPETLLKNDSIDYVVLGEPEEAVSKLSCCLFNKIGDLSNIKSLGYKNNSALYINERGDSRDSYDYPIMPNRSLLRNDKYIMPLTGKPFTVIKVSRGCDFGCSFCTSKAYYGKGWKSRSPENIIAEIKDVKEKYGIDSFLFLSDTFNGDNDFVDKLCSLIIENNLNIKWVSNSRPDLVRESTVSLMKKAGCMLVSLGIESYDEDVLKINKSGIDKENINRCIGIFKKYDIITYGYFIFGLEKESKRSIFKTILEASNSGLDFAMFYSLTPFPGTEYFSRYNNFDWGKYFHGTSVFGNSNLGKAVIKACIYTAFIMFYIKPRRLIMLIKYFLRGRLL